jgi:hypothetical protein
MTTNLYYSVISHVPDPVRAEGVNLGIVVVIPNDLDLRFIDDAKHIKCFDPSFDADQLEGMQLEWRSWLKNEMLQAGMKPEFFLEGLAEKYDQGQTRFSLPRLVEVDGEAVDSVQMAQVLDNLYSRLVAPPPAPQRARSVRQRISIRRQLKHDLRQLKLLDLVKEGQWVSGTVDHPVSFIVQNGHTVAIDLVEPEKGYSTPEELTTAATLTLGKWQDVRSSGQNGHTPELVSIIPGDQEPVSIKTRRMLDKVSDRVLAYPEQKAEIFQLISSAKPGQLDEVAHGKE